MEGKKLCQHDMARLIKTSWGVVYQICQENE